LSPWVPGEGEGDGVPPDGPPATSAAGLRVSVRPRVTFQAEDAVAQGVHDVVEGGLVADVEEVFLIRVAGDVLDLADEILWVLLPAEVVPQHLRRGDAASAGGRVPTPAQPGWGCPAPAWCEGGVGKLRHSTGSREDGGQGAHRDGVAGDVALLALLQRLGQLLAVVGLAVRHHDHQPGGIRPPAPLGAEGFGAAARTGGTRLSPTPLLSPVPAPDPNPAPKISSTPDLSLSSR